jgi:hypothetical protein
VDIKSLYFLTFFSGSASAVVSIRMREGREKGIDHPLTQRPFFTYTAIFKEKVNFGGK